MATIRTYKKENPFVMIDKRPLEDVRLSWEAKGLHAYLMSKPDNWTVNVKHLIKQSRNGRDATYRIVNELILAGYIKRNQEQNEDGTFREIEYIVHELPTHFDPFEMPKTKKKKTQTEPHPEIPYTDKPDTENPDISNNDLNKNEITKVIDDDNALTRDDINLLIFEEYKEQITPEQFAKILQRIPSNKKTTDYRQYLVKCVQTEIEELNRKALEQSTQQQVAAAQESKPKGRNKTTVKRKTEIKTASPTDNYNAPQIDDAEYEEMLKLAKEMSQSKTGRESATFSV